jgi:tetratricopeptide (TPR) repeat protein
MENTEGITEPMVTWDQMYGLAIELRNAGELRDAIGVLSTMLFNYPEERRMYGALTALGGIYAELDEHFKAMIYSKIATELNRKYEPASVLLYYSYIGTNRDEEAMEQMIRYLKVCPMKLYSVALVILLHQMQGGYMPTYKEKIEEVAAMHGIIKK